ncbi:hypothetical protein IFM58399_10162 [Aspergillus lentulus]|uniref:Peptidase A2 domain-containing protein n=1 Tax=Aspergillus lentulus TaxID=293939 RepID=A0ABQ1B345_ASPLE|nr:uncharacterized protein IFM58399_10162 [Aspergillus lentulus]GFF55798.1 hypothetical protein IFM58399_10162 [Aspergillus lentulus]GFF92870.1 hypothetical protein IFM60648_09893 [Aspergillus lentulus]
MADPLSLVPPLLSLTSWAVELTRRLHRTIGTFQKQREAIQQLDDELQNLEQIRFNRAALLMTPTREGIHRLANLMAQKANTNSSVIPLVSRRYFVNGELNDIPVEALPDTGADECFISRALASKFGLEPCPGSQKRIYLANNMTVLSPGMVEVPWKFTGERMIHTLNCWILPGCTHDLVLGSHFLRATQTLTKFVQRIKSEIVALPRRLRLQLLGKGSQRLLGYLDGHFTAAFPDTGSDVMLISKDFAEKLGLAIDYDGRNRLEIELGDGTTAQTNGIVKDVSWDVGGRSIRCDFHVFDDLCVDVVLSNNYLFEFRVFSDCSDYFCSNPDEVLPQLCNIRLIGRYGASLDLLEEEYLEDGMSSLY